MRPFKILLYISCQPTDPERRMLHALAELIGHKQF